MAEIPLAPLERILKNEGAKRISPEATKILRDSVEEYAQALAESAVMVAKHAGRKTVLPADITLVRV